MFKKSSFNPRDKKSTGGPARKDDSRGGSYKKPYKKEGSSRGDDDRSERPKRASGEGGSGGSRFEKKEGYPKKTRDSGAYWKDKSTDKPAFKPREFGEKRASDFKKDEADRPARKPYNSDRPKSDDRSAPRGRKPFGDKDDRGERDAPRREFSKPYKKDDTRGESSERKPFKRDDRGERDAPRKEFSKPYKKDDTRGEGSERKPFKRDDREVRDTPPRRDAGKSYKKDDTRGEGGERKSFSRDKPGDGKPSSRAGKRPFPARDNGDARPPRKEFGKPYKKDGDSTTGRSKPYSGRIGATGETDDNKKETPADFYTKKSKPFTSAENRYLDDDSEEWEFIEDKKNKKKKPAEAASYPMPLNKYIAHSGECSRRDAAELVKQGKAKVNGELIVDPGHKINEEDKVTLSGKKLVPQKGRVYILLNKPKGFITTNDDPQGRRTVMELVASADVGRLFAVGRLDRATTGLILLTNDGDLAQKLAHPSHNMKKVYHVTLDKRLTQTDFEKIMEGIELEDGKAVVDEMAYLENNNEIGLEIHSGKNRIVRRIFESLGYVVDKLDRVMYAGLTKKNLPRSKWRFLDEREIVLLKHFKV